MRRVRRSRVDLTTGKILTLVCNPREVVSAQLYLGCPVISPKGLKDARGGRKKMQARSASSWSPLNRPH